MGQYHYIFNLDKKEYLDPHEFSDGLKLREFGNSSGGTMTGLAYLLACSSGRGGGDFERGPNCGRWAGDRIAIIGDYAEQTDIPGVEVDLTTIQDNGTYTNISVNIACECVDCRP